jgi:lysophospholipase L1-like esterase
VAPAVRSWVVSGLFLVGSFGIPLLAGEGACRLAGYRALEQYRPDSVLGWVPTPGQRTVTRVNSFPVRIDAEGFRGAALQSPKPVGTVRIFAMGASTTFGWGVRQEDVWEQRLEQMLNDMARAARAKERYEVVNAGVIGFNLRQSTRYMRRIAQRWQPDGFIVAYTFNDGWNRFGSPGAPALGRVLTGVRAKNLLRRSALYNWLVDLLARRRYAAAAARSPDQIAESQTGDGPAAAQELADFHATLDSMLAVAHQAHVSLALMVRGARRQGAAWPRQAQMERFAVDVHLPLLDLVAIFGAPSGDSLFLPYDAVHPTPRGHALIARLLYAELCRAALTAAPSSPDAIYRVGCDAARRRR